MFLNSKNQFICFFYNQALGSFGIISGFDDDGDVVVSYPSGNRFVIICIVRTYETTL